MSEIEEFEENENKIKYIADQVNSGKAKIGDFVDELKSLDFYLVGDIGCALEKDEDKLELLRLNIIRIGNLRIVKTIKDDNFILEALKLSRTDNERFKIVTTCLKSDLAKKEGMIEIKDEKYRYVSGFSLSREGAKKEFLRQDRKYDEIGIDKKITFGIEIESEGEYSQEIKDIGLNNGEIKNKDDVCGKVLKNRRWRK